MRSAFALLIHSNLRSADDVQPLGVAPKLNGRNGGEWRRMGKGLRSKPLTC